MLQIAQDFFKRNKKAKACHVVLDNVFESLQSAKAYQKTVSAHCITSYLKKEADPTDTPEGPAEKSELKF